MSAQLPKSILKKSRSHAGPSKTTSTSTAQPTTSKLSNPPKSANSKAKHTVSLKVKGERVKGDDMESESEGNVSGFEGGSDVDMSGDEFEVGSGGEEGGEDDDEEGAGTDEEIEGMKDRPKSKKNTKRKRPPTTASIFGSTLTSLLSDSLVKPSKSKPLPEPEIETPSTKKQKTETETSISKPKSTKKSKTTPNPILALSTRRLPPSQASLSLEAKAARLLKIEKEEKEDRARVRDVVTGWTPALNADGTENAVGSQEFERGLKKVAQRGVIKLFNAILVASKNAEQETETSLAQARLKPDMPKNKREKDNLLGRGGKKEEVLTKESFLDLVRKGGSK